MTPCTIRSRFLATSYTDSRLPRLISAGDRYNEKPPSWWMPTSKVTRVRSDGFSKSIASAWPASDSEYRWGFALISVASSRKCRISCGEKSLIERKSLELIDNSMAQKTARAPGQSCLRQVMTIKIGLANELGSEGAVPHPADEGLQAETSPSITSYEGCRGQASRPEERDVHWLRTGAGKGRDGRENRKGK